MYLYSYEKKHNGEYPFLRPDAINLYDLNSQFVSNNFGIYPTHCTFNYYDPSRKFFPNLLLYTIQYLDDIPKGVSNPKSPEKIDYPELKYPNKTQKELITETIDNNNIIKNSQIFQNEENKDKADKSNRKRSDSEIKKKDEKSKQKLSPRRTSLLNYKPIREIIPKVIKWRSISYIEYAQKGKKILSKEQAAQTLKIKKKSFDDYQLFLRLGIACNFDFKSHLDNSFNILRKYVKSFKPRIHWDKAINPDIESLLDILENSNP